MKLTFIGAAHEVTGSCLFLEAQGKNILIDCGLEQGRDVYINEELPVTPNQIDCILLTHAHVDHVGRLPILYANGFRGKIHTTNATSGLCEIMLLDSAHIQESEAEWKNRKGKRKGEKEVRPLYTVEDAKHIIKSFVSYEYEEKITLYPGIEIRFIDSGHLLGSASIEMWVQENNVERKIVFSGDIGNINQPLIQDPQYIQEADYVVMESTYGDREHGASADYLKELTKIIQTTFDRGGNVLIPAFAVGRTQVLLYYIRKIKADGLIKGHDGFKVYVDSPLANEATEVFAQNMIGYFDKEAMELVHQGINPISFTGLVKSITSQESKAINFDKEPKVIIAGSGMCDAGRIKHHLKHNLWRMESSVLFVGHQSKGTLGKAILDGAKEVKLFGETIKVSAQIYKLEGVSGHADREGLLKWIKQFNPKPNQVFVVHGDDTICEQFAKTLREELNMNAVAPFSGDGYDLASNQWFKRGSKELAKDAKSYNKNTTYEYEQLISVGNKLLETLQKKEIRNKKNLSKIIEQINGLIDSLTLE